MRTLVLLLALAPSLLAAQPALTLDTVALVTTPDTPGPERLIGTYATEDARLHVARSGQQLVLTLAGQPAFDAFAEAPANPALNARAEALLRDAFAGSTDRLAAALPAHRQEAGTLDFARLLTALADARGPVASVAALGTNASGEGLAETYVRVRFADGEELLKLKWRDGELALITRGRLPQVTAHPVRGTAERFAVLDERGAPVTLLVFTGGEMTARGSGSTLVAARTF